jgi:hypothetical protein
MARWINLSFVYRGIARARSEGGHAFDRATRGTYSIADMKVRFFVFLELQDAEEIAGWEDGMG